MIVWKNTQRQCQFLVNGLPRLETENLAMVLVPHLMLTQDQSVSMTDVSNYVEKLNAMSAPVDGDSSESMVSDDLDWTGWW